MLRVAAETPLFHQHPRWIFGWRKGSVMKQYVFLTLYGRWQKGNQYLFCAGHIFLRFRRFSVSGLYAIRAFHRCHLLMYMWLKIQDKTFSPRQQWEEKCPNSFLNGFVGTSWQTLRIPSELPASRESVQQFTGFLGFSERMSMTVCKEANACLSSKWKYLRAMGGLKCLNV